MKEIQNEINKPSDPNDIEYPFEWEKQEQNCNLFELQQQSDEYIKIAQLFNETSNKQVVSIKRIQNQSLYKNYYLEKMKMEENHALLKLQQNQHIQEQFVGDLDLWHGTRHSHPSLIYESIQEGFDTTYSSQKCMWGPGAYFAKNSQYSEYYSYKTPNNTNLMLLCQVSLGYCIQIEPQKFIRPPDINPHNKAEGTFDSVGGYTNGSQVYILYTMQARRGYPKYVVEFTN